MKSLIYFVVNMLLWYSMLNATIVVVCCKSDPLAGNNCGQTTVYVVKNFSDKSMNTLKAAGSHKYI